MSNWYAGWILVLTAFASGAVIGLFFYRDDWLGGYASFRRRILRLGHIALAALGIINVVVGIQQLVLSHPLSVLGQWTFILGGITMPLVCWLSAWRPGFRHAFFIPVTCLIAAVVETLKAGLS